MNRQARRVLIVAYHYPPVAGSSGVQRTLKFTAYLRDFGWEPMVLTVHPRAYERVTDGQMAEIPAGMVIERAQAWDSARHLSIAGRYPNWLALPDRWCSWWPHGVWTGWRMIRQWRPQALMSTFPMASAHLIGHTLQRFSGLPWIADFRDNMTEPGYPPDPRMYRFNVRLESRAVHACTRALFTTRGALQMYAARYPDVAPERWAVIENGYDEENFSRAETGLAAAAAATDAPLRLIHSGILYPAERDPTAFFTAVARLKATGAVDARRLQIVLRATGSDAFYAPRLAAAGIDDIVRLEPPVGYEQALREMMQADGLLLFQATMANHQIPAKLYEYMRAGRPILALTDPDGDTAAAMRAARTGVICKLADADDITAQLEAFVDGLRSGSAQGTARAEAERHSRRARTAELAALLNDVATAR